MSGLRAARVAWLVVTAVTTALFVAALPTYFTTAQQVCPDDVCPIGFTRLQAEELRAAGIPIAAVASYISALRVALAALFVAVGAALFARRGRDVQTLLGAFALVLFGLVTFGANPSTPLAAANVGYPVGLFATRLLSFLGDAGLILFFLLFPDSRFIPRWTRWVALVYAASAVPRAFAPESPFSVGAVFPLVLLALVSAQIHRYRRVSNPTQQQQTKWVVFGVSAALIGFLVLLEAVLVATGGASGQLTVAMQLVLFTAISLFIALIPISIGVAMLRYRLYDIDLLINRTLVYGATIALTFWIGILTLQAVLSPLTSGSELAVAASTLVSFALFQPIRRRVQDAIDRRFDRSRYDAARTLDAFADRLRDEVDLDALRGDLLGAVMQTMAPAHASLWLRTERP
jgi:hypothetical protein